VRYFIDRLREPSTYAGFAAVLAFVYPVSPEVMQSVAQIGMGAAGLAAIFIKDPGN